MISVKSRFTETANDSFAATVARCIFIDRRPTLAPRGTAHPHRCFVDFSRHFLPNSFMRTRHFF
ncbi:hypothetical protein [Burkholderia dolosa]|uniref:hypothetical protein n=1 Tax=Burkholderia dolosa TaxID=152500 RepID=UPI001BAD4865|nr:hypothetical protein [Burkholderia dolosa]